MICIRTLCPWLDMLDIIIDLIYQSIPIGNVPTAFLKIRRLDNVLQQHWIQMERIIGAPRWHQVLGTIILGNQVKQKKCNVSSFFPRIEKHTLGSYPSFFDC